MRKTLALVALAALAAGCTDAYSPESTAPQDEQPQGGHATEGVPTDEESEPLANATPTAASGASDADTRR